MQNIVNFTIKCTFKTIREKEAFENIRKIYNEYRLETCLEASVNDTQKLMLERQNFTYGEISLLSFHELLSVAKPKENEIFYDLGCGAAKPVIYASFLFPFKKCCGIELLPTVYELAAQYEKRYNLLIEGKQYKHTDYEIKPNIKIMKGDMLEIDFSDADIIYLPCTTFDVPTMKKISKCCAKLKPGTRIITLTKPLPCLTEKDCTVIFNVFDKREWLMTWGLEPVIYQMKE